MTKKSATPALAKLIAAARAAGTATASDWEQGNALSFEDHRLRSLMNFERDVVQSTADDKDALPQWRAFLEAHNEDDRNHSMIYMDAARGRRFHFALGLLLDALDSLEAMIPLFPKGGPVLAKGEIMPEVAVRGVLKAIDPVTSLMLAMASDEEQGIHYPGLFVELQENSND